MKAQGMRIYPARRINLAILGNKPIAILGYGSQGRAQALNLRDSGFEPIIGLPTGSRSRQRAFSDKFRIKTPSDAVKDADIVAVLAPDHVHGELFANDIGKAIHPGQIFIFAHALSVHFKLIEQPTGIDFLLVAPHAPGLRMRERFMRGGSVSAFIGKTDKSSEKSLRFAAAYAKAIGCNHRALIVSSFTDEAVGDIFGEQAVLCGGLAGLIKAGYKTLVKSGIPPHNAYLECIYQLDLIVDLIKRYGIGGMYERISLTARYGSTRAENKIINAQSEKAMGELLKGIKSGKFVKELLKNSKKGVAAKPARAANTYQQQIDCLARRFSSISDQ
jgi:ketol-acid reductoisomerase